MRAIWFGHASVLFELEGLRVMVDPVLSEVVSPVPVGPTRFHPPPIALRDLGGNTMLHWATFNLAYHAWDEPIVRTLAEAKRLNVRVVTPRVGEAVEFGQAFENTAWFRK